MSVRIVTDSSANLPAAVAEQLDITVVPLHRMSDSGGASTAGLSALELVAVYARQLERGGDDGVVAIHLSKELSSTWSAAVTAAGVFDDGAVHVVDTQTVGMGLGAAAMAAARLAQQGASLDECYAQAADTLRRCSLWLYVHKIEHLRKSGRLSPTDALISTAFAIRPILHLAGGRLELAAKTRTQVKAWAKLCDFAQELAGGRACFVAIQHFEAREPAEQLAQQMRERLAEGSSVMVVRMDKTLAVHAGLGAVAVSVVVGEHDPGTAGA